jgi:hypothetical protein
MSHCSRETIPVCEIAGVAIGGFSFDLVHSEELLRSSTNGDAAKQSLSEQWRRDSLRSRAARRCVESRNQKRERREVRLETRKEKLERRKKNPALRRWEAGNAETL